MADASESITSALNAWGCGDRAAGDSALARLYPQLKSRAGARMADERFVHTLQTTALVHEALLRLLSQPAPGPWENREHFLAAAARAMRHVLVDRARRRATLKRETPGRRVELEIVEVEAPVDDSIARRLLALDESLDRLRQRNPVHAQIVELRFFGELTMPEIAEVVGISLRQAERSWRAARAWLHFEVEGQND